MIEMTLHQFYDTQQLSSNVANHVVQLANQTITKRGRFTIAFSGGSLPKLLCPPLLKNPLYSQINWSAWHIFFADERCVPLDHADSNYRLVKETLLDHVDIPPQQIYAIDEQFSPVILAEMYQQKLYQVFDTHPPRFDLILLGMGPDGHTASLFPKHPVLHEQNLWVASMTDSPKPPPERITLTLPVINNARAVIFVVTGASKAEPLQQIVSGENQLPAGLIQPNTGVCHWFVDSSATSLMEQS